MAIRELLKKESVINGLKAMGSAGMAELAIHANGPDISTYMIPGIVIFTGAAATYGVRTYSAWRAERAAADAPATAEPPEDTATTQAPEADYLQDIIRHAPATRTTYSTKKRRG